MSVTILISQNRPKPEGFEPKIPQKNSEAKILVKKKFGGVKKFLRKNLGLESRKKTLGRN